MKLINQQVYEPILRYGSGAQSQITFTLDFHELVTGELLPNASCVIRYDPLRLVSTNNGYIHGDPQHPITLHYQFLINGPIHDRVLESSCGIINEPVVDITGQGSMLQSEIFIPKDAQEFIAWFSYTDRNGDVHYDSDLGRNFRFRFVSQDLQLHQAVVTSDPQTLYSGFGVEVAAIPAITQVVVRFIVLNQPNFPKSNVPLNNTAQTTSDGYTIWSAFGIAVPYQATIRFKLFYTINGQRYKDDNSGKYFIAPIPEPLKVPIPKGKLAKINILT